MALTVSPSAGYILDVAHGEKQPQPLSQRDSRRLRDLAQKVAEIAAHPKQVDRRNLWYRHNKLEKVRPMLLLFLEDSWEEIIDERQLQVESGFWRQWEWYLRHLIYRDAMLPDDFVVEPTLYIPKVIHRGDWGLRSASVRPTGLNPGQKGAWKWDPPLKNPADIEKLRHPTMEVDDAATGRIEDAVSEVFEDILEVRVACALPHVNLIGDACALRGIEQLMLDMYERPEWLHQLMAFVAEGFTRQVNHLEEHGHLTLNNGPHYVDCGGIGYSTELPSPNDDGEHVRLRDLWTHGMAQEMAWVGPEQHEEFVLRYQLPVLQRCGLTAYGCCEPYTWKFDMVKKIANLRRVSVSPWCDIEVAAQALEDAYIYSWKPNPAMLVGRYDPDAIRSYIRRTLEITRDCVLEIILKDTITLDHEPARVETWARIAREEIDRFCQAS